MSRLSIDITDKQHQHLKAVAALQGKTIKQYALERLFPAADPDDAWSELTELLRDRIAKGLAGDVSQKSVNEIVDEELSPGKSA
ncbi:antitoxin [Novosphingobium sp. CCH12-A3]|uniref:antitoxin n=1 Tax=Novosphingobium sp. CCH12-A3 TaxID=1768752 RepID=UPI000782E5F8|nr:antitoxin [Novosphingobium sp. CCH12-A3]